MTNLKNILLTPIKREVVSAEHFLQIFAQEKNNFQSATPLLTALGSKDLGRIVVVRKHPAFASIFPGLRK